ncbi:hypothetical protein [Parafrankia sp. BMG5.11]|uniref:Uncharacterized protein n=1 Tax=Parafrankia soli TaxID=2599596 RepID=A0A1S1PNT2_9ACTN|nr:hypothetical protein [Parafrankia sp. BMG5.11]ABW15826.1 hypothetical protein Franean1_6489 [Frankia sp. EAN1pec]OHV22839.1 hypothetical protein BBK14_24910 [Parafrankia soli]
MARHRSPASPRRSTRPGGHRRAVRPAVTAATVVAAGAVTVGTAFAVSGSTSVAPPVPAQRVGVVTASVGGPGTVVPSAQESSVIVNAVRSSALTSAVPPESYRVTGTVLARSDQSWAWVELVPVTDEVDRAEGVLHRGDSGWELIQIGSYEVGCGIVPSAVAADLDLECPSDQPGFDA